ncbi:site-specific integrase [Halomonas alkaliantarctica]|uniref:site-specific integrase n=1 Tax=Halomonas alkaliantarctica TaxID=232346 RepID=UPI0004AACDDD|nr:site-specific integrase [Halomonas alkaliantarctica]
MEKSTEEAYRSLAANFYAKRLNGELPTPKKITDALKACASEYRPAYWRRLRNALEFDQRSKRFYESADRIAHTRNPMTTTRTGQGLINPRDRGPTPPKQRRAKSISEADYQKLIDALTDTKNDAEHQNNFEVLAATLLAKYLGVRPAEMLSLEIDDRGIVRVRGAKRTSDGKRGADRWFRVEPEIQKYISTSISVLQKGEQRQLGVMRRVQSRLDRLSRKLWPRRQARPSLYTFRHQMGGDLKAMGLNRRAIAYIMGHQSTKSVEVYGDRRKASGGIGIKLSGQEAERFQGRENHTAAPDGLPESKVPPALRAVAQSLKSETPETPVRQEKPAKPVVSPSSSGFRGPGGPGM